MKRFAPYLLLLAEVVLFYRHILFADYVLPWDLRGFNLPLAHLYSDSLKHGELPLWDPYTYCGRPFQANSQTQVFYPPMAMVAWLGAKFGVQHLLYLLNLDVVLHVFLAGVFAYWLGLALRLSRPAALLLGTIYMLGGFFAPQASHFTAVSTAAWLPLVLYCLVKCRERITWRYGLLLAATLALGILAGSMAVVMATWTAALLFVVFTRNWRLAITLGSAFAGAALLAAVQLAPSLQLTSLSIAKYQLDWLGKGGGIPLQALVSLVSPNHYGLFDLATYHLPLELTFVYLYCGIPALTFVLASIIRPGSRLVWIFVGLLVLSGLAMLGDYTPLGRAAYALVPRDTRAGLQPEYASPVFILCLAALAALGMGRVLRSERLQWTAVAICAADLILVSSGRPMNAMPIKAEPGIARHSFGGWAETVLRVRAFTRQYSPQARIEATGDGLNWAMAAPTMRIPSANGNDLLAPARLIYARLAFCKGERWGSYYEPENLRSPVLGMMNVRYLIARYPLEERQLSGSPFEFSAEIPGFIVYENKTALPRFWLVSKIRRAASEDEAAALLHSPEFKPSEEAIVEGSPSFENREEAPESTIKVLRYGLKDVVLEVETAQPSYLASSETHYPGWRAWLDGSEQTLLYTNVAFRGLVIPSGKHVLRMAFTPPLLNWFGLLSLAGWLTWAALWWRKAG